VFLSACLEFLFSCLVSCGDEILLSVAAGCCSNIWWNSSRSAASGYSKVTEALCIGRWRQWQHVTGLTVTSTPVFTFLWLDSLVAKALDWWLDGCEFKPQPLRCRVTTVGKLFTLVPRSPSSIIWYWWCCLAGKVTCRPGGKYDSLPLGGRLKVTCGLTACTPGSAPGTMLITSIGEH